MMRTAPGHRPAPVSSASIDDALRRAVQAMQVQRPDEAERLTGEVLKADPHHIGALHIFGCALLLQRRAAEAIAPLEAVARARRDPQVDIQLATALRDAGRLDEALAQLRRAVKRQPPFAPAFHALGCALASNKQYDEAIDVFRRGLTAAPMMSELAVGLGHAFRERRNFAEAKAAFTQALAISPQSYEALYGMAKTHHDADENETAAEYYRRCLAIRPAPGTWLDLARCLLDCGQVEAGYDCLRWAVRGDAKRYGQALSSMLKPARGRFWLRPSAAARFLQRPGSV